METEPHGIGGSHTRMGGGARHCYPKSQFTARIRVDMYYKNTFGYFMILVNVHVFADMADSSCRIDSGRLPRTIRSMTGVQGSFNGNL